MKKLLVLYLMLAWNRLEKKRENKDQRMRQGSRIYVDSYSGGRYLVFLCGPCHIYCIKVRVFICSKSAFCPSPLLSSRVINAGGYVIIGPLRITGLADCDDCIKACRTSFFFFCFYQRTPSDELLMEQEWRQNGVLQSDERSRKKRGRGEEEREGGKAGRFR